MFRDHFNSFFEALSEFYIVVIFDKKGFEVHWRLDQAKIFQASSLLME